MQRRFFLKGAMLSVTALSLAGLVTWPKRLLAMRNESAFESKKFDDAVQKFYGKTKFTPSKDIKISAPNIAENGAVVPVKVSSDIPDAESITIFVKNNPYPLIASFMIADGMAQKIATRIKMAKTSNFYAVVKVGDTLYAHHQEIKVTIGGCGG